MSHELYPAVLRHQSVDPSVNRVLQSLIVSLVLSCLAYAMQRWLVFLLVCWRRLQLALNAGARLVFVFGSRNYDHVTPLLYMTCIGCVF